MGKLLKKTKKAADVDVSFVMKDGAIEKVASTVKEVAKKAPKKERGYSLPKGKRTGKYAKILENRDHRVIFENKLFRANPDLFKEYLSIQKSKTTLDEWKVRFYLPALDNLTDKQLKHVK